MKINMESIGQGNQTTRTTKIYSNAAWKNLSRTERKWWRFHKWVVRKKISVCDLFWLNVQYWCDIARQWIVLKMLRLNCPRCKRLKMSVIKWFVFWGAHRDSFIFQIRFMDWTSHFNVRRQFPALHLDHYSKPRLLIIYYFGYGCQMFFLHVPSCTCTSVFYFDVNLSIKRYIVIVIEA